METLINYGSGDQIKGHLEVIKLYADGTEEVHFSDYLWNGVHSTESICFFGSWDD